MSTPLHPLVELATGALQRLSKVPRFGEGHEESAAELEKMWIRAPLVVAIGGPVVARTELWNYLCDKKVLDPEGRPNDSAALTVRRGKQTRFKATRDDGSVEEHVLPPEQADDDALRMRAEATKAEVQERQLALQRIEKSLPRGARARPRGLMIWLWPLWWLLTRRQRRVLAERKFSEIAYDQACDARDLAAKELEEAETRIRRERGRFFESLRALASGPPLGGNVREVLLVLGEGPLPEGVELIELSRSTQASDVDAIFLVERDVLHAPHGKDAPAVPVGKTTDVIPQLLALLGRARSLGIARRAHEEITEPLTNLDDEVTDTEEGFRVRIERLEAMQILDPEEFATAELAKVRPQVSQSIHAVIEHAAHHLGGELQRLGDEWQRAIASSRNNDELKIAVQRIEASAPLDAKRIAEETRMLAVGGAAGSAHDLFPELLTPLRAHGLEEPPPREAPQLPPLDILPSLLNQSPSKLSGAAGWLGGLFKSFESRRADVGTKAEMRMKHLREVAGAEILDVEPKLRTIIEQTLYQMTLAAIERQVAWLDKTLTLEREAVSREGIALAPLARMRDRLRHDHQKLAEGIEQIEKDYAGLAAAAAAVTVVEGRATTDVEDIDEDVDMD
ncbi:MAG TPA: hypothetical protein VL326_25460 [Kofleriaceae bacterium]|nr:hypothetical protein [Kofleriaceae bacterium]